MSDFIDSNFDSLDPNGRLNPVVDNVSLTGDNKVQRIVDIAVPFLCLYGPTALATNVALSTVKSVQIIKSLSHQKNSTDVCKQLANLALTISTLALSILMPAVGIGVSQFYSVCVQVDRLRAAIQGQNYKEAAEAAANIALSALYVASVITSAPEMIVISILAQAAFEMYQASGEFRKGKGRFLEGMAKVAMAAVRLSQAAPMIKDLHRDYFGKQITQADLDRYMRSKRERQESKEDTVTSDVNHRGHEGETTFEEFAYLQNYSRKINNLYFSDEYITNESFKKFRFYNCEFVETTFEKCTFTDTRFEKCSFDEVFMWNCVLKNTSFVDSLFQNHCMYFGSNLANVTFNNCDLTQVVFTDAQLNKTTFEQSTLKETCFLGATVKASKIINSDLTDTLFCGTQSKFAISGGTPHRMTRPVVGILWDHTQPAAFASYGCEAIEKAGGITLKVDYRLREISRSKLESQVDSSIGKIRQMNRSAYLSIGDEVLNRAAPGSEVAKIHQKAAQAVKYSDGVYLPGGEDISVQFYNANSTNNDKSSYARSVLETALLKEAFAEDLPILTACRGTQMLNVYQGGTLHQSVSGHAGVYHTFQYDKTIPQHLQDITQDLVNHDPYFQGISMHHQGCDKIGQGLFVTMRAEDGLPECLISENGKAVGTQFHPEYFVNWSEELSGIYAASMNFFTRFVGLADEHRQSQMDVA